MAEPPAPTPSTVSELADAFIAWCHSIGITNAHNIAGETDESPLYQNLPPGSDVGEEFMGLTLAGGEDVSIVFSYTE